MFPSHVLFRFLVVVFVCIAGAAAADVIHLNNTQKINGLIVGEDAKVVRIQTGKSVLSIARARISSIERGQLNADAALAAAGQSLARGRELHGQGNAAEAHKELVRGLQDLNEVTKDMKQPPASLTDLKKQFEAELNIEKKVDPAQKAQETLAQAQGLLDKMQYDEAYRLLKVAAELDPTRSDIQLSLGKLAEEHANQEDVAIQAYRRALELAPEKSYEQAAAPLLRLVRKTGGRLLAERRTDLALPLFQEVLLLMGDEESKPASVAEYMTRRALQASQSEDQVLMEVYKYADTNDLVDLALASITRVRELRPQDAQTAHAAEETGFLAQYRQLLDEGKTDQAAALHEAAPAAIGQSPRVIERIKQYSEKTSTAALEKRLLDQAHAAFDRADYDKAAELSRKFLNDYKESASAGDATALLKKAELELPLKQGLGEIEALIHKGEYAGAEAGLTELASSKKDALETSVQKSRIDELRKRIERERQAENEWTLASADLERNRLREALTRLEKLARDLGETRSGGKARDWLATHRQSTVARSQEAKTIDLGLFSQLANSRFWTEGGMRGATGSAAAQHMVRQAAWEAFDDLRLQDDERLRDRRPIWIYIYLPLGAGLFFMVTIGWAYASGAAGRLAGTPPPPDRPAAPTPDVDDEATCRMCGCGVIQEQSECPVCGSPANLSELENIRRTDMDRKGDFNPWEMRVRTDIGNRFEEFYQQARQLRDRNQGEQAVEACRAALREDPHSEPGYELMAELYEAAGDKKKAVICYREILMLNPGASAVRQKLLSILSILQRQPLRVEKLVTWLSVSCWWVIFWTAYGLTNGLRPHLWAWLAAGSVPCCVGTVLLWRRLKTRRLHVRAPNRELPDINTTIPAGRESWFGTNRRSRQIARQMAAHTQLRIPALDGWRMLAVGIASMALLVALVGVAWINDAPLTLLAWPVAFLLFLYTLEIHPRAMVAHVLLRHFFEETLSPWADPHRPFSLTQLSPAVSGEFLIRGIDEFPLGWALSAFPYGRKRRDLLNSLQATLNRHFDCHRFYDKLRIVRDYEMPVPSGIRRLLLLLLGLVALGIAGWVMIDLGRTAQAIQYKNAMTRGYKRLLDGQMKEAIPQFEKAQLIEPRRAAPYLYLAHAEAAEKNAKAAEDNFRMAMKLSRGPMVLNDFANYLQKQGRLRDAVPIYEDALRERPTDPDILNNLGACLFKLKDYREAEKYLRQAIEARARHDRAHTTLGLVYEATSRPREARDEFKKAVEVAPQHPYTQVARNRLAEPLDLPKLDDAATTGTN